MSLFYYEDLALHKAIIKALGDTSMDPRGLPHSPSKNLQAVGRDLQLAPTNLTLSKKQYDDIVLDGSGSMMDQWWDMLAAIDGYVDQLKINQLDSHIRLSIFTSGEPEYMDLVARNCPIGEWVPLLQDPVGSCFNSTPLYDAIVLTGKRLAKLDPERASVLIVTDGQEAGSKYANLTQAKAVIDWMKAKGWQVTFIGCDFNNQKLAQQLGINPAAAIGVHKAQVNEAIRALADKRARHGKTGAPIHWTDDEKQEFGGYLNAPDKSIN